MEESKLNKGNPSSRQHAVKSKNISKLQILLISVIFVFVVMGILAIPYYQNYIQPFNRAVITIDNKNISMRYFIQQIKLNNSDAMSMLQTLTREELIKMVAPKYGIGVTDADITRYLRIKAAGPGQIISDVEFREWYRQQLNKNRVTDAQYKASTAYTILYNRLQEYMAARVPTIMPQINLNWIVVKTQNDANKAVARINAGESFAAVASDVSLDASTKSNGGDLGWYPFEVAASQFSISQSIIDKLAVDQISEPFAHYSQQSSTSSSRQNQTPDYWYILMVSGKDSSRPVSTSNLSILKSKAVDDWYNIEVKKHKISYHFNSEIYSWINYQLKKGSPVTPGTTTTTTSK